jgi:ABC-type transport system involved in multi-copper enzyme maturation permease subunit
MPVVLAINWLPLTLGGIAVLIVAAILTRAGWLKLFGPVLMFEVVRAARQGRYFLIRGLYAGGLFLLLLWVYLLWTLDHSAGRVPPEELGQLAEVFFYIYALTQFIAVVLLTPGYVAGCIADDKERRTIEFLLATDLANREIIFGKMVARVGNLMLFLITGLPVLSIIQFFGGIDPAILLLSFAATALTMLGLIGVSMMQSVQRRRVRDAIIVSYLLAFAYVGVCQLLWLLQTLAGEAGNTVYLSIMTFLDPAINVFRWGDPIRAFYEVAKTIGGTGARGPMLLSILGEFAAFHLTVFVLGVGYAVWRVRALALHQAGGGEPKPKKKTRAFRRPPVSQDRPMVWKEVHVEGKMKLGPVGRTGLNLLVALGFVPLGIMTYFFFLDNRNMSWSNYQEGINVWVRCMNVPLSCLMLIAIAVRAAISISGERDKDTFVSLMTTPLEASEIVGGKFWGALASARALTLWLMIVWAIGLMTFSVSIAGLPIQLFALIPPACVAAAWGLFCSTWCRTTLRALMTSLLGMVFILGGHWLVTGFCCFLPMALARTGGDGMDYLAAFQIGGTPPVVFGFAPLSYDEDWWTQRDGPVYVTLAFVGLLTWLVVAVVVGRAALDRFAEQTNRGRPRRDHLPPPPPGVAA